MHLAIDSGNTNVVFGLYDAQQNKGLWRLKNDPERPADEYIVYLQEWLRMTQCNLSQIEGIIISSVVPDTLVHLKNLVEMYFHKTPLIVGEDGLDLGVKVKIDRPETLGADRLVNTFGGYRKYGGPLVIIDFGTATTFDIVDSEGSYVGGIIAPGVNLSLKALYEATAKLPATPFARTEKVIGTNTKHAMQSGTYWGYVGMIDGLSTRLIAEYKPQNLTFVATGGLSSLFANDLSLITHVNENLTLDSLSEIYELNN
jgi:type III pantothenate kinase